MALFGQKLICFGEDPTLSSEQTSFIDRHKSNLLLIEMKLSGLNWAFFDRNNSHSADIAQVQTILAYFGRKRTVSVEYSVSAKFLFSICLCFGFRCFGKKSVMFGPYRCEHLTNRYAQDSAARAKPSHSDIGRRFLSIETLIRVLEHSICNKLLGLFASVPISYQQ